MATKYKMIILLLDPFLSSSNYQLELTQETFPCAFRYLQTEDYDDSF